MSEFICSKLGDSHMHTNWTDGANSIEEMLECAKTLDLQWVIFSEHNRKTSAYSYKEFYEDLMTYQSKYSSIKIFSGVECKALDTEGSLDIHPEALKYAFPITGVVHRFPGESDGIFNKKSISTYRSHKNPLATEIELSLALVSNPHVNILGHPLGMSIKRFQINLSAKDFVPIIEACRVHGTIFECNITYHKNIFFDLLSYCIELDCPWTIGSNSHSIRQLKDSWQFFRNQ